MLGIILNCSSVLALSKVSQSNPELDDIASLLSLLAPGSSDSASPSWVLGI